MLATLVQLAVIVQLATPLPSMVPDPMRVKAAPIAAAVKHPGPLLVEPEATSELSKGFGNPLWALGIATEDESFAHATVLLLEGGSFLKPDTIAHLDAAVAAPKGIAESIRDELDQRLAHAGSPRDTERTQRDMEQFAHLQRSGLLVRPVALPNGRRGYTSLLGFGPYGAGFMTALQGPNDRYELLVLTETAFEGQPPKPNAQAAIYQEAMRDHPLDVNQAIALAIYAQLWPAPAATPPPDGAPR
ncbi:MAG: hypothetical protein ACRERC_26760 [Candidatus Binatia bacterium]